MVGLSKRPPVLTKADMYVRLTAGEFGNTIPQFFSVAEWKASGHDKLYPSWGVRSARHAMHPACRMYCPTAEVEEYAAKHFADGVNISSMIDQVLGIRAWLEVFESYNGLVVEGVIKPKIHEGWNWRNSMREPTRRQGFSGSAARAILRTLLNANSYDDLTILLDAYQDHVVELSATDRCFGTVPGRDAVIWEVRKY